MLLHQCLYGFTVTDIKHTTSETIMTETLLTRLLLAFGLLAGLMLGTGNLAAGVALSVIAGAATWLVRSQNLVQRRC